MYVWRWRLGGAASGTGSWCRASTLSKLWRGSIRVKCSASKCASLAASAWKRRPKCSKYRPLPCGASGAPPRFGSTASWRAGQAMDSERWKQLDRLLQSVLERPPEERDAFLLQACAGDEVLE